MSNFRRGKPRRQVKCSMCTDARAGNSKAWGTGRHPVIVRRADAADRAIREYRESLP
jgi:hypothetical protein